MSSQDEQKRRAARRALAFLADGMRVGLGTGSTVRHFLEGLAERRRDGALREVVGVPTSRGTELLARELGIPLTTLHDSPRLDLAVDGADEADSSLRLIKGLGGALLWEKIVASASDRMLVVVDRSKLVERLGVRKPLPVEVVSFGWSLHVPAFRGLGAEAVLRRQPDGEPLVTDGGHYILDLHFPDGLEQPEAVNAEIRRRPGVVETGLFLGLATAVLVGEENGVRILGDPEGSRG